MTCTKSLSLGNGAFTFGPSIGSNSSAGSCRAEKEKEMDDVCLEVTTTTYSTEQATPAMTCKDDIDTSVTSTGSTVSMNSPDPSVAAAVTTAPETAPTAVPINIHKRSAPTNNSNTNPWIPTKEPRKYDAQVEEEGCEQILKALTKQEIQDMSDGNLIMRHFRADKGDIEKSIKRIKYAIQWRKEFGVEQIIKAAHLHEKTNNNESKNEIRSMLMNESSTGKMYSRGYDRHGRAIMYIDQKRENTNHAENNIQHLVYQIERAIACSKKNGYEKIVVILDFTGWKMKHSSSLSVTKTTIHVLQDCYVESVHKLIATNPPQIFRTFYNMIKVFLDPTTKSKIVFVSTDADRKELEQSLDPQTCEESVFRRGLAANMKEFDCKAYYDLPLNKTFGE